MKREILAEGRFLRLVREGHWEYAERTGAAGAVIIVAVTLEGKLLLVEQERIPTHCRTIELPAGITGDQPGTPAESPVQAAGRELLEETGYAAAKIIPLTTGPASGGLASEVVTLFLATGLRKEGHGGGVESERIVVHEVPLATAEKWLAEKAAGGILIDPKIYAGLFFLTRGSAET